MKTKNEMKKACSIVELAIEAELRHLDIENLKEDEYNNVTDFLNNIINYCESIKDDMSVKEDESEE